MGKGSPSRVPKYPREWVLSFPSPRSQHYTKLSVQFQTKLGAGKKKVHLGQNFCFFSSQRLGKE